MCADALAGAVPAAGYTGGVGGQPVGGGGLVAGIGLADIYCVGPVPGYFQVLWLGSAGRGYQGNRPLRGVLCKPDFRAGIAQCSAYAGTAAADAAAARGGCFPGGGAILAERDVCQPSQTRDAAQGADLRGGLGRTAAGRRHGQ